MTSSSTAPSNASRRRLPKWLKVTIITVLIVANLAVLGLFWAINTGQGLFSGASTDEDVVDVLTKPTGDDLTFLLVGSDSREGLDSLENFGPAGGQRGDVVMLVHLDSASGDARILSIPRDLWVDIPGHGEGKINAAYAYGGSSLMVETVQKNLGIPINHYVEVGFVGFMSLVDDIGGIEIAFPYPARDQSSGLNVDAGNQLLNGAEALSYARSRKYQELQNGSWVSVEANDLGRTQRQQQVVRAILSELKSPSSIADAGQIVEGLSQHLTIDASLAKASVARLAWDFKSLLLGGIDGVTLPVDLATRGGASVVLRHEPDASQVIADFLSGSTAAAGPLRIQVLNGNGVGGSAGRMSQELESAGFVVVGIGDAERKDYDITTVMVPTGASYGQRLLAEIGSGVVVVGDIDDRYDAVVIVGADVS